MTDEGYDLNRGPHHVYESEGVHAFNGHRILQTWTEMPTEALQPNHASSVTYTWNNINAEALVRVSGTLNKLKSCFSGGPSQKKQILNNVSGVAYPGEILAIMGSSGAGKTSLLKALSFQQSMLKVSGERAINGRITNRRSLASVSAYFHQDDLFVGTLTVQEHLTFQASLRMSSEVPKEEKVSRVNEIMTELNLAKCRNTSIGIEGRIKGISGGGRRLLSMATELLTNPSVMFCYEPTSGLDSYMAQNVITVLKAKALKGKTIICTIHQPSSEVYALFDKILLMTEGRVAFLGSPDEAQSFFSSLGATLPSHFNPADIFIQELSVVPMEEEICRSKISVICNRFQDSPLGHRVSRISKNMTKDTSHTNEQKVPPCKGSWIGQFRCVLWRSVVTVLRDPLLLRKLFIWNVITALLFVNSFHQENLNQRKVMNINGLFLMVVTNMTLPLLFATIRVLGPEIPLFIRERAIGLYRTDVYFVSKIICHLSLTILLATVFTSITYFLIKLNPEAGNFAMELLICILICSVATSLGSLLSAIIPDSQSAMSIAAPIIFFLYIFSGFFIKLSSIPVYLKWLSFISWFRYANQALNLNQWTGVDHIDCTNPRVPCYKNGAMVLETYGLSEESLVWNCIGLVFFTVGFKVLSFMVLVYRTSRA